MSCRAAARRCRAATVAGLALLAAVAHAEPRWPAVALPPDVRPYSMGQQVSAAGMPIQMQGFVAQAAPAEIAAWLRKHLERPVMEDKLGDKLILGRASDGFYVTIQLEPMGKGTRGLVAVADLGQAHRNRDAIGADRERLLARFPHGSRLLTSLASTDGPKTSTYVVIANSYSEEVNRQRVIDMLGDDGLRLEREARPAASSARPLPPGAGNGSTLFFKGRGKEAIAVVGRGLDGHVTVVVNTITLMEQFK
jgi:hypothetical protein